MSPDPSGQVSSPTCDNTGTHSRGRAAGSLTPLPHVGMAELIGGDANDQADRCELC